MDRGSAGLAAGPGVWRKKNRCGPACPGHPLSLCVGFGTTGHRFGRGPEGLGAGGAQGAEASPSGSDGGPPGRQIPQRERPPGVGDQALLRVSAYLGQLGLSLWQGKALGDEAVAGRQLIMQPGPELSGLGRPW